MHILVHSRLLLTPQAILLRDKTRIAGLHCRHNAQGSQDPRSIQAQQRRLLLHRRRTGNMGHQFDPIRQGGHLGNPEL